MAADILVWPWCTLTPSRPQADPVPFTRGGGRSLGGIEKVTQTDRGFWKISYGGIILRNRDRGQWNAWQAIRVALGGRDGLIAVRAPQAASAPYFSGRWEAPAETLHDDDTPYDDDTPHVQGAIDVETIDEVAIGAGTIRLKIIQAYADLTGVRFSYQHALYETGPAIDVDGDIWTVPIFPTVRAPIPAVASLEFDEPTCLCRLSDDRAMDLPGDLIKKGVSVDLSFDEATDFWSDLAAE